jgi:hypothetical protein
MEFTGCDVETISKLCILLYLYDTIIRQLTKRITHLELGNLKVPSSHPSDPNPQFLPNLAFGTLWTFPNLVHLKVYLSFSNSEEQLVDIVKQVKQGRIWFLIFR